MESNVEGQTHTCLYTRLALLCPSVSAMGMYSSDNFKISKLELTNHLGSRPVVLNLSCTSESRKRFLNFPLQENLQTESHVGVQRSQTLRCECCRATSTQMKKQHLQHSESPPLPTMTPRGVIVPTSKHHQLVFPVSELYRNESSTVQTFLFVGFVQPYVGELRPCHRLFSLVYTVKLHTLPQFILSPIDAI